MDDDDQRTTAEEQVEDLDMPAEDASEVKGGGGVTALDDWETPTTSFQGDPGARGASPRLNQRGGWDGNHSEILVTL